MKHFICRDCGNLVAMVNDSGRRVGCCGSGMDELTPNFKDGAKEKHAPELKVKDGVVTVTVGSADNRHPQTPEHAIAWVCLLTDRGSQRKMLRPDGESEAVFYIGDDERVLKAFAYCNVHGLWVTECK